MKNQCRIAAIVAITLFMFLPLQTATAQPAPQREGLDRLWFDVSLGEPLVAWFNQAARPTDIARANNISDLDLLNQVQVGRKLMIFKSVRAAEENLPRMAADIDIIGYNLEGGDVSPQEDQDNPVASIKRMRELADRHDLALAIGPDHDFAVDYGVQLAPYVDIFVLQIQRVQTDPARVNEFVVPLVDRLRQANPSIQTAVQVRTEGNVPAVVDLIDSLQESLDGVAILTSSTTLDVYEELTATLRPGAPQIDLSAIAAAEPKAPDGQQVRSYFPSDPFALGLLAGLTGAFLLMIVPAVIIVWVAIALILLMAAYRLLMPRAERS